MNIFSRFSGCLLLLLAFAPGSVHAQDNDFSVERTIATTHTGLMYGMDASSDGQYIATGADDGNIKVWYGSSGGLYKTIFAGDGGTKLINKVAMSADGQYVAASIGKNVMVYNVNSGSLVKKCIGLDEIWGLAFSPDGQYMASGDAKGNIDFWKVTNNFALTKTIYSAHSHTVYTVDFSHDGQYLASGANGFSESDHSVKVWNVGSWNNVKTLNDHTDGVLRVAFSPNGKYLASGGYDKFAKIYNVGSWSLAKDYSAYETVFGLAFSHDNNWLALGLSDEIVMLQPNNNFSYKSPELKEHSGSIYGTAFTTGGKLITSSSADKKVVVWSSGYGGYAFEEESYSGSGSVSGAGGDGAFGVERILTTAHTGLMYGTDATADGSYIATGADDGYIKIWNGSSGSLYKSIFAGDGSDTKLINKVAISPNGQYVAAAIGKNVMVYNVSSGSLAKKCIGLDQVWGLAFSADGQWLASGDAKGNIDFWKATNTFALTKTIYSAHAYTVYSLSFSKDSKYLASGANGKTEDHSVKVWDVGGWNNIKTLNDHSDGVLKVAFSPSGKYLASGGYDKFVKIYNVGSWSLAKDYSAYETIYGLAFSYDDNWLALGLGDEIVMLQPKNNFSYKSPELKEHSGSIYGAVFTQSGRLITSSSSDKKVVIWSSGAAGAGAGAIASYDDGGWEADIVVAKDGSGQYNSVQSAIDAAEFGSVIRVKPGIYYENITFTKDGITLRGDGPDLVTINGSGDNIMKIADNSTGEISGFTITGSDGLGGGITFNDSYILFANNVVKDNKNYGMYIWGGAPTIQNNTIVGNAQGEYGDAKDGIGMNGTSAVIKNNIIANNGQGGGLDAESESYGVIAYNCVYNNGAGNYKKCSPGAGSISVDPQFSDYTTYKLSASSPCKYAGEGGVDMGAYGTVGELAYEEEDYSDWDDYFSTEDEYAGVTSFYAGGLSGSLQQTVFTNHTALIGALAVSPDSRYFVTASDDKTAKVWEIPGGTAKATLPGHSGLVGDVAISPDGKYIATVGGNDIKIWDAGSFNLVTTLYGHGSTVWSVTFSGDSKYLASGSGDKSIKIWNVTSNFTLEKTLYGHGYTVYKVAFSPDNKYLASCASGIEQDHSVKIWSVAGWYNVKTLDDHDDSVYSLAFSPDGKYLVSGGWDKAIKVYDVSGGSFSSIKTLTGHGGAVYTLSFSPDGKYLASSGSSGGSSADVLFWSVAGNFNKAGTLAAHSETSRGVQFTRDGKYFITSASDKIAKIWSTSGIAGGTTVIAAGSVYKGNVNVTLSKSLSGHSDVVRIASVTPNGKYGISGDKDGKVVFWNLETGSKIKETNIHTSYLNGVDYSRDGTKFVTGSSDHKIIIWDAKTGNTKRIIDEAHTDLIVPVAFSPDGKYVASGGFDQLVKVWNVSTGSEVATLTGHTSSLWSLRFSHDGSILASGDSDDEIILWNTTSWSKIRSMKTYNSSNWINGLAFSNDNKTLYAGCYDNKVYLFNVSSGSSIGEWSGHTGSIWGISLSPDGNVLASAAGDKSVILWDAKSGSQITKFSNYTLEGKSVAFSLSGNRMVVGADQFRVYTVGGISGEKIQVVQKPTFPPFLTATADFDDSQGNANKLLDGAETATIKVTVKNTGKGKASGVNASLKLIEGSLGVIVGSGIVYVGDIEPGATKTATTTISATEDVFSQNVTLKIVGTELNGFDSDPVLLKFNSKALEPPVLALAKYLLRDDNTGMSTGNGDGEIQKGEQIEITCFIQNKGKGDAIGVNVVLATPSKDILVSQGNSVIGEIKAGDWKKAVFAFAVNKRYAGADELPLKLELQENRPKYSKSVSAELTLGKTYKAEQVVTVESSDLDSDFQLKELPVIDVKKVIEDTKKGLKGIIDIDKEKDKLGVDLPERNNVYGLVIGINEYGGKVPSLKYSENDAKAFYSSLVHPGTGGVPKDNILLLLGEDANFQGMMSGFTWLLNQGVEEDATLIFYFSGHGAPGEPEGGEVKTGYLVPFGSDPATLKFLSPSIEMIQSELSKVNSKQVLVALDACFSGSGKSFVAEGKKGITLAPKNLFKTLDKGKLVLSASASDETSNEFDKSDDIPHSLFTYYLIEGMEGKADETEVGNKNGWVEINELFSFVKEKVSKKALKSGKGKQNPQLTGAGDFKLTRNYKLLSTKGTENRIDKIKSVYESGDIDAGVLTKAIQEIKSGEESRTLQDFLDGKIDLETFKIIYK